MKLLSPKELKATLREEEDRLRSQALQTEKLVHVEEKKLNDLRTRYILAEVELRKEQELKEQAYKEAEKQVLSELAALETKRIALAYSVDEKRMKEREHAVKVLEVALSSREAYCHDWKKELEQIERKLEKDLQSLAESQKAMVELDRIARIAEKKIERDTERSFTILAGLEAREDMVSLKEKELAEQIPLFRYKQAQEEFALREFETSLRSQEEKIKQDRIAVADGYATLAQARERILGRKT